jgi:predicted GIY-YIG superfamily endonuclease
MESMNPMQSPSTRDVSPAFTPPGSPGRDGENSLHALLLRSAELNVKIRRTYQRLKPLSDAKFFTYVLLLHDGCIYVGNSDNIYVRLMEHFLQSPNSSHWVRERGPVVRVIELIHHSSKDDEMYKMLEWCDLVGHDKVRGAAYCKVDSRSPPPPLVTFRRDPTRTFQYASRAEIDEIVHMSLQLARQLST